ncbi:hypothetical protein [Nonomuraea typhae]|uniref:Uncharacterized protein n=1 Tax=Nonomuraea typhae TaxID=2603600 RepID=A0ABW7YUZ8_9ACTN
MDHHGWGELADELHRLSLRQRWPQMSHLINDDVLHTFALIGTPQQVGRHLRRHDHRALLDLVLRRAPERPQLLAEA